MELSEYLKIIRKRLWMIMTATIVLAITAAVLSIFVIDPVYEGKVTLVIGRANSSINDKVGYDDILMYQKLVKTYSEFVKSRLVIDETISRLKYDLTYKDMEKNLKVNSRGDTQILEIVTEGKNPEKTLQLANTLSEIFIEKVKTIMDSADIKILDKAQIPDKPVKPVIILNIVIAAFIGLISSFGLALLMEYLDNTLKDQDDIEEHLGMTVLANIPNVQNKKR